jgi:hypothetical protein
MSASAEALEMFSEESNKRRDSEGKTKDEQEGKVCMPSFDPVKSHNFCGYDNSIVKESDTNEAVAWRGENKKVARRKKSGVVIDRRKNRRR